MRSLVMMLSVAAIAAGTLATTNPATAAAPTQTTTSHVTIEADKVMREWLDVDSNRLRVVKVRTKGAVADAWVTKNREFLAIRAGKKRGKGKAVLIYRLCTGSKCTAKKKHVVKVQVTPRTKARNDNAKVRNGKFVTVNVRRNDSGFAGTVIYPVTRNLPRGVTVKTVGKSKIRVTVKNRNLIGKTVRVPYEHIGDAVYGKAVLRVKVRR